MDATEIGPRRLHQQHLAGPPSADPVEAVRRLGCVQAQEYAVAKWSLGQRSGGGVTDAAVQSLLDEGVILRTHILRPTWHFVLGSELGWIQAATAHRVHVFNGYYNRGHGLTPEVAARTNEVITSALRGGNHLTRNELGAALAAAGFEATGNKLAYVVMFAELEGLIANGVMRGKQHTYALVSERVPDPVTLSAPEALAELTRRYFTSHGPATVKDFAWWSSLTVAEIKQGIALCGDALAHEVVDGRTLWFAADAPPPAPAPAASLLQGYDEYVVAYSDTKFVYNVASASPDPGRYTDNMMFHPIAFDGQVGAFWRRKVKPKGIALEIDLLIEPTARHRKALAAEIDRYAAFTGLPVTVTYV
ncbi:winged helix DNA-binding domain-containing protein [Asanoa sp. WMMD1127]|uniref:winged helix DNA-binding domain-containing protein n=1 Tax=Asanoa sp. WMMD1127 TaxID=3016107 RepID=UPI0024176AED|nr:winged helix DNA-binding domain-containing protein [Asanoa sp. WMMD1127]MDG4824381.1 winged helix DNA-binding domain-containing protein [Asanoa sp. WMMD1127]